MFVCYHTNPTPSINWLSVSPEGCLPSNIASWMSGASSTSLRSATRSSDS